MDDLAGMLDRVRSRLGADAIGYVEFLGNDAVVRLLVGDGGRYGLAVDDRIPLGSVPGLVDTSGTAAVLFADLAAHPAAVTAFATWRVAPRAYMAVPVQLGTGQTVGLLSVLYHAPVAHLGPRDLDSLRFTADLLAPELVETGQGTRLRARVRERVRAVIASEAVRMVYQPIIELRSGRTAMVEALSRFDLQPSRPPNLWFAEATRLGLGVDLELTAMKLALADLDLMPVDSRLSLNVSVATLLSGAVHEVLDGEVSHRVVLEVTETAVVPSYAELLSAFSGLRAQGVRLAVDDLGAGFAGLSHLTGLHPDVVKIDRGIVQWAGSDPTHDALISALVDFATTTGADIVGEGIETQRCAAALAASGVGYGQGHLFAVPDRPGLLRRRYPSAVGSVSRPAGVGPGQDAPT
jgi:EAL domain-containing protein (putative c-di-GMP-specific phosphodiesterase class I)